MAADQELELAGRTVRFTQVDVGNPHAVLEWTGELEQVWPVVAAGLETHARFPQRTNVELVRAEGPRQLRVELHERGVGPTAASGTGALAAAIAATHLGLSPPGPVRVRMLGGELEVEASAEAASLCGPVLLVFEGELSLAALGE